MTDISAKVILAIENSTGRKVWHVKDKDLARLHRLWMWSQRYSISLEYVTGTLVTYFARGVERHTGRKSKGLGVSIPTLTGDVAENILRQQIEKDFPDRENVAAYRDAQQTYCYDTLEHQDVQVRIKPTLEYRTLKRATDAIVQSIELRRARYQKIARSLKKIPFRANPFR